MNGISLSGVPCELFLCRGIEISLHKYNEPDLQTRIHHKLFNMPLYFCFDDINASISIYIDCMFPCRPPKIRRPGRSGDTSAMAMAVLVSYSLSTVCDGLLFNKFMSSAHK